MHLLLEKVEIFPEKQENGKIIKHIYFNFPVWYDDEEVFGIGWKSESRGETVVLFSKGEISTKRIRVEFPMENMDMSGFQQGATYEEIQTYVFEKYALM